MFNRWDFNAHYVVMTYGSQVDWEERFYICPECGEPVYDCDWTSEELSEALCPICGYNEEELDKEEIEEEKEGEEDDE